MESTPSDTETSDAATPLAARLFEAFRAVAPFKRRPGLGQMQRPGEFQLIHRLANEPHDSGLRVGDLAGWLGVKPPTVTQLVDALAAKGLVDRFPDDADRRAIRVRLSSDGRKMADSIRGKALEETEALVEYLGKEDGERLADLLLKTASFLSSRYGPACPSGCGHHKASGVE